MIQRGTSDVFEYLKEVDKTLDTLYSKGKISKPTRACFFKEFLGLHAFTYRNWYKTGIKKIFKEVLWLSKEIK